MKINSFRAMTMALAIGLVPVLGACGGNDDADTNLNVPPATSTADQPLRVTEVELGRSIGADRRVNDNAETDDFTPRDTIYASVDTDGAANGATLTARWTFEDGQLVEETSQTVSATGVTVTEFHISKPDGFPVGKYKVAILLNGQEVETEDFEVKAR